MAFTEKQKGTLCLMCSSFCFSVMSVFVRLAGDLPSIQKAFTRNLVSTLISGSMLFRARTRVHVQDLPMLSLRTVCGTLAIVANFYAVERLTLADASLLSKLSPFFTILFSCLFLGERIAPYQVVALCGAFAAGTLVVKPSHTLSHRVFPACIGAVGGMMTGAAHTCVRYLSTRGVEKFLVIFFFSFGSLLLLLPAFIWQYQPMSSPQVLTLWAAGVAVAGAQFFLTVAYRYAPKKSIPIDYTHILFSTGIGFLYFKEVPDHCTVAGIGIILAIALYVFARERERKEPTVPSHTR